MIVSVFGREVIISYGGVETIVETGYNHAEGLRDKAEALRLQADELLRFAEVLESASKVV